MDEDTCSGCGCPGMIDPRKAVLSVTRWDPVALDVVTVAVLCTDRCLARWARRRTNP